LLKYGSSPIRWHQVLAWLARRNAFQLEIPMCMIHLHCFLASNHREFSFDGADDTATQDLLD